MLFIFFTGLNNSEVKENAVTFFVAGYDTTANTLAFACYCLATNHDIQDKCLEEIDNILHGVSINLTSHAQFANIINSTVFKLFNL